MFLETKKQSPASIKRVKIIWNQDTPPKEIQSSMITGVKATIEP